MKYKQSINIKEGIKKIRDYLTELVEEGRINKETFELMNKLCLEWFGDDDHEFSPDKFYN